MNDRLPGEVSNHPIVVAARAPGATPKEKLRARLLLAGYDAVTEDPPSAAAMKAVFRRAVPAGALVAYIVRKAQRYIEPQRRGTPRGDSIGFSSAKYRAALLTMTRLSLRDAARAAGVSYGVLAKWKTEDDFMKVVDAHIWEFMTGVWGAVVIANWHQYEADLASLFTLPRAEADAAIHAFSPRFVYFADYALYGGRLIKALVARLDARLQRENVGIWVAGTYVSGDDLAANLAVMENQIWRTLFLPMLLGDREMKRIVGRKTRDDLLRVIAEVERALGMATEDDPERERRIALLALGTVRRIAERLDA
jgi:hypothetical protein